MTIADLLRRYEPDLRDTSCDRDEVMRALKRDARGVRIDSDELDTLETISQDRPAAFAEALVTLIVELSKD